MAVTQIPRFKLAFLAPRYWLLWLGIGIWRGILLLPYPVLTQIGCALGWLFGHLSVGKKRLKVAKRNLELAFPHLSQAEIQRLLQENQRSVGMAIIETGMAWFWSDKRIQRWSKTIGSEYLQQFSQKGEPRGILLVGVHFLTLELGARIIGLSRPGIGVYRPNDNPVFDWLQVRGRMRSNKMLLDRKDLRGMIKALKQGEMIWYAPDHDYGRKNAVFAPFFAVQQAATTSGSYYLLRSVPHCAIIPFVPRRLENNKGYLLTIEPPVTLNSSESPETVATEMNHIIEHSILQACDQYMWMHRRFKTRPNEQENLYH